MRRVLANLPLPSPPGFAVRHFGDYPDPKASKPWKAEFERRDLRDILALIPAGERPDIVVMASPEYLPIPVDIASFPGPKVLLITDWNVCLRFLPDLCSLFDYCFTDWPGFKLLRRAGVKNIRHQPLFGHDPARFRDLGRTRDLDISFCGNFNASLHEERNGLVERVRAWAERRGRRAFLKQAFDTAYVDVLNRSRLVFNYSIRGEANMRLFEAMACGAVPLVEEGNQEAPILFREGTHYFRYAPETLEARLDELLAHPERIAAAGEAARKEVAKHTKAKQLGELLTHVAEHGAVEAKAQETKHIKALIKMRVLGAGYTLAEAVEECRARAIKLPGLDFETIPGLLLTLIEDHPGEPLEEVHRLLNAMLRDACCPPLLREYFITRPSGAPPAALRGYFLPPVGLGRELNARINLALRCEFAGRAPSL